MKDSRHARESRTVLDSGFHPVDSGFQVLDACPFLWNLDSGFQSLWTYQGQGGGGGQGMEWRFDIFQKIAVKFPAHGQIIPVNCNQLSPPRGDIAVHPKAGPKKGTTEISPNKTLQSLFINVAASPKIHVPVTASVIRFNHSIRVLVHCIEYRNL